VPPEPIAASAREREAALKPIIETCAEVRIVLGAAGLVITSASGAGGVLTLDVDNARQLVGALARALARYDGARKRSAYARRSWLARHPSGAVDGA